MSSATRILLKLTGEIFCTKDTGTLSPTLAQSLARQIKKLSSTHQFGVVIGGGNFFRGRDHGATLGISPSVGHQVGMLATMMNGLIFKDILEQNGIRTAVFCAIPSPEIGAPISQQVITSALESGITPLFTGGTGNPFFTTDTNAILRALQMSATHIWKGTGVDGVYDADPRTNPQAKRLAHVSYTQALEHNLGIMDPTAYALAREHNATVRVFNIFEPDALILAAQDNNFGSMIQ